MSLWPELIGGMSIHAPYGFVVVRERDGGLDEGAAGNGIVADSGVAGGVTDDGESYAETEGLGVDCLEPRGGEEGG